MQCTGSTLSERNSFPRNLTHLIYGNLEVFSLVISYCFVLHRTSTIFNGYNESIMRPVIQVAPLSKHFKTRCLAIERRAPSTHHRDRRVRNLAETMHGPSFSRWRKTARTCASQQLFVVPGKLAMRAATLPFFSMRAPETQAGTRVGCTISMGASTRTPARLKEPFLPTTEG